MLTIEERIQGIHRNYIDVICPYVLLYELLDNTFPIEILNEIRAVFTHLSKCNISDDVQVKEDNLSKAESHIKRAVLDCYKYICMAYHDNYTKFENNYRNVDLSLVDNGEFLPNLLKARKKALDLMLEARMSDLAIPSGGEGAVDEAYAKYEMAFIAYYSVDEIINESYEKLENLKKKVALKNKLAVGSFAIGIIGICLSIVFYLT